MAAGTTTPVAAPGTVQLRSKRLPVVGVLIACAVAAGMYVAFPPHAPDLAAQVARVQALRDGASVWWNGWFGGVNLPDYSAISPFVMAHVGVVTASALAVIATTLLAFPLVRDTRRPLAGTIAIFFAALANVLAGRASFALGMAAGIGALVALRKRWAFATAAGAVLAYLFSPLAGFFTGIGVAGVGVGDRTRRRPALVGGAALAIAAGLQAFTLPAGGHMPFPWWFAAIALAMTVAVALACPSPTVRVACAITSGALVVFSIVPGPVGMNVVRLPWLAAAPTVVAVARLRKRVLIPLALLLALWPMIDLGVQLDRSTSPSAHQAFYQPLLAALTTEMNQAGPNALGQRVEVVDPASHWSAAYVTREFPIARGWYRQADEADNPLFYNHTLTSDTYHAWLLDMAVGWVALPSNVQLDFASRDEAAVINSQPDYLHLVWANMSWALYRVTDARPLVQGANVLASTSTGIMFDAEKAGQVDVQVRWSPYLRLTQAGQVVGTCIMNNQPWTSVTVPSPGIYSLTARAGLAPGNPSASCAPTPMQEFLH